MSIAPLIVGAAEATTGQFSGMGSQVLVYAGLFVLWGLIGLIPLLSKEPTFETPKSPPPEWTVVGAPSEAPGSAAGRLKDAGLTIDRSFVEVREPPRLSGQDPRWGR